MIIIISVIIIITSTLYFINKINNDKNQKKMKIMQTIMLNNLKEILNLKNSKEEMQSTIINMKKKLDGLDNLVKYLYLRKIIKVIISSLIKKYYKDLIIYKENEFINFKFQETENLSSKNAEILNKFKENYYKNYYEKFNNYIHLNFKNSQNGPINYNQFNANDTSNEILKKSLEFLLNEKIINLEEKKIIFDELLDTEFNIYKEDQEIQKLLKKNKIKEI